MDENQTTYVDLEGTGHVGTADVEHPDTPADADFATRVARLVQMQKDDPEVQMTMLAEMYVFVTDFERMARTMALNGGPMQMIKAMMGKG